MFSDLPKRPCPYCRNKGIKIELRFSQLRAHIRKEHYGKRCEICGRNFDNEGRTKMHVARRAIGGCKEHMAYYGFIANSHFGMLTEQKRKSKAFRNECLNIAMSIAPKLSNSYESI